MLLVELYERYGQLKNKLHPHIKIRRGLLVMSTMEYITGTSGTGSLFYIIVCRFDSDTKFSELVDYLAFDSHSNLSLSTDDHNIDTDSSLESFISLENLCKLTPLA